MRPTARIALSIIACALAAPPGAALATGPTVQEERAGMEFRMVEGRSAFGLTRWVQASGRIAPDTPERFRAFSEQHPVRGLTVALDSFGGSIYAGLELGRMFRSAGLRTIVGRTVVSLDEPRTATLVSSGALCASACAYAFLGGNARAMPSDAALEVHQFSRFRRIDGQYARDMVSIEDFQEAQTAAARIAVYIEEMGVSVRMLELASMHPYGTRYHRLTATEITNLRVGSPVAQAEVDAPPVPWSIDLRHDDPVLYRRSSRPTAGGRVDGDVLIGCARDGNLLVHARIILAEARHGEFLEISRVETRLGSVVLTMNGDPVRVPVDENVWMSFQRPRQMLIEAAERRELSIEATGTGRIQLGEGLAQALPRLLDACDARQRLASAQ